MSAVLKEEDRAKDQARSQHECICEMVAALSCDYDRLEGLQDENDNQALAEDESLELLALQEAAGDCTNQEQALERIHEDPLSVEVRSGWYTPGDEHPPEEFSILLCTGGPAVRIRGELGEHNEPRRAWLEYQDWGTPWTQYYDTEQDTLLAYCSQFFYGE